ncbi:hypothetical protein BDV96DRAFT_193525 [Lophiotrema nucula]|uniref:Uncharacterized protein n=1 Tax=Lophiotrema nucula TaxID=690887 RepID=A0A6A5YVZ5_9PLEO|nr:hypothetical protein BDV96DRAFT_193525 [Lophiotrema nucula]
MSTSPTLLKRFQGKKRFVFIMCSDQATGSPCNDTIEAEPFPNLTDHDKQDGSTSGPPPMAIYHQYTGLDPINPVEEAFTRRRYTIEFPHINEAAVRRVIRLGTSMDPNAPILIHASEAKHFLVAAYHHSRKKYGDLHLAFHSNGSLSPLYSEVRRYLINAHKQTPGPLRYVSPNEIVHELGACLKLALSEYIPTSKELAASVLPKQAEELQPEPILDSDYSKRLRQSKRKVDASHLVEFAMEKSAVIGEVGLIWQECVWLWLDMCYWRHVSRLEDERPIAHEETHVESSKRRFAKLLKFWRCGTR